MKFLADIEVEQGSDATFVDNAKAFFGTGNDLQIYHDASNSYIDQTGTGKIILNTSSTGINVQSGTGETRFTKSGTDSEIKIDDTNQVNKVVLKSDGDSLFLGGDLGVGTTTTDSIFHIKDTGKLTQLTIESDTGQAGQISFISPSVFDGSISMESDGDFRISNSANTQFLFTGDTSNSRLGLGVNNTSPTQQLHLTDNIRVEGAYYDSTGASGSPGSNGQVLSSTVTGTAWVAAGGGGGGSIGGSITATQVAFGGTTSNEITGVSTFLYTDTGNIEQISLGDATSGVRTSMTLFHPNSANTRARYELIAGTTLTGYLQSQNNTGEVTLASEQNLLLESGSTEDILMSSQSGSKVGIGTSSPTQKLTVNGTIYSEQAIGEVIVAGSASFDNKFITIRSGSNYAARWGLQAEDNIVTSGVMLMSSAKPMAFRSSTNIDFDTVGASHLIIKSTSMNGTANVGIGTDDPQSKLQVAGGIQMADDNAGLNIAAKAGTLRYREDVNIGTPKASNTFIDMYMRTEDSTYEWVNIVTNNW